MLVTAGEHVAGGLQFDNHFSEQPHEPFWAELMRDYASELPNVKMVFSMWDEPLSWTADLPADVEAALQNGSLSLADAWASHSCNSVPELEAIQHLHGHLASSTSMGLRKRGLLPVFSRFKIDGCLGGECAFPCLPTRRWCLAMKTPHPLISSQTFSSREH